MVQQRTLLGWALGLAALPAWAQWPGPPPGAPPTGAPGFKLPCGPAAFPTALSCLEAPRLRLHTTPGLARSLDLQLQPLARPRWPQGMPPAQGLRLGLLGQASLAEDLALYGHLGTTLGRLPPQLAGAPEGAAGLGWGVGLRWEFSPRGAAVLGWDRWDLRSGTEPVWGTSLGLRWRY